MSDDPVFEEDNPEWTDNDFARAVPLERMPLELIAAFPKSAERLRNVQLPDEGSASSITMMVFSQSAGAVSARLAA